MCGLQELLLHMHPLAAMALVALVLVGMALLPRWDRQDENIGVYFRSRTGAGQRSWALFWA